jgi:hypothetical protein
MIIAAAVGLTVNFIGMMFLIAGGMVEDILMGLLNIMFLLLVAQKKKNMKTCYSLSRTSP